MIDMYQVLMFSAWKSKSRFSKLLMEKCQDAVLTSDKTSVKRKAELIDQFRELIRNSSPHAIEEALSIIQRKEL